MRLLFFFFFSHSDVGLPTLTSSAAFVRRMEWWQSSGYRSRCLPPVDSGGEDEEEEEDDEDAGSVCSADSTSTDINYVLGDVTHPHMAASDAIIVHCVGRRGVFIESGGRAECVPLQPVIYCYFFSPCGDDSGRWGRGGLFTALEVRSDEPRKQYELAGKMKGECRRCLRSVEEMFSFCPSRARPAPREVWSCCRLRRAAQRLQSRRQTTSENHELGPTAALLLQNVASRKESVHLFISLQIWSSDTCCSSPSTTSSPDLAAETR